MNSACAIKKENMERLAEHRDNLRKNPKLTYLFFELTDACNLACLHCGSNACPQNKTYLSSDIIKKVLESVSTRYDPSEIMVCLTGGEPLLHPDFLHISKCVKELGFSCGMTTNGTLINPAMATQLVSDGVDSVTVSIDGMASTHDWFRNASGSFDRAILGVRNLMNTTRGRISTQITTVVHKKNLHELDRIYELVVSLKVDSWRAINLEPIGRALEHNDLLLAPSELRYLFNYIRKKRFDPEVKMDVTYGCSHYLTLEHERAVRDTYFLCGSGIYVGSVLCSGDIYSCLDIERRPELIQGNVYKDDFVDIWECGFQEFRKDRTLQSAKCKNCDDRYICGGDSAHTWDYDNQEPMLCIKDILSRAKERLCNETC